MKKPGRNGILSDKITTVFAIDGSGDKNRKTAERKRPIYRWDAGVDRVCRVTPQADQSALDLFLAAMESASDADQILIAADLPIGIPVDPSDVYASAKPPTFLGWLNEVAKRCENDCWRSELIANGVDRRSRDQPFVSLGKGQQRGGWDGKRRCDRIANAESVYAVDHGPKQVGKAALQFWFEVMIPLRRSFPKQTAVWPFEETKNAKVIFAECYPALCQRMLFGGNVSKRNALAVATALSELANDSETRAVAGLPTWIHAASSEDEFDMFVTAIAISKLIRKQGSIFQSPADPEIQQVEGWILGLDCEGTNTMMGR